jgi:hypothetical protein
MLLYQFTSGMMLASLPARTIARPSASVIATPSEVAMQEAAFNRSHNRRLAGP